ncbi:MAG: fold metallo-hydrolase, partial [Conexibacter sp.]|nr:fold metallo-hydrolase [Conexibacter sp.]
ATGPRLVARAATGDAALARASLAAIAQTHAHTVLPGHGAPWTEGAARAAELARAEPIA